MQSYNRHLAVAVMLLSTAACRDVATPATGSRPDETRGIPLSAPLARVQPSPRRISPAEFHANNKQDWVGRAHNRAMDELRREIRAKRPRDLCPVIDRIALAALNDPGIPAHLRGDSRAARAYARESCAEVRRRNRGGRSGRDEPAFRSAAFRQEAELSAEAWGLVGQIDAAAAATDNVGDFANALAAISAAAQSLPGEEPAVIDALTSVALSSAEYWEQYGQVAAQEFTAAYESCAETASSPDQCVLAISAPGTAPPRAPIMSLVAHTNPGTAVCEFSGGIVWKADVSGATTGLAIGLKFAKSPVAALATMIGVGVGASAMAFVGETTRLFWCIWHQ